MFGRRRKSTKHLEAFAPVSAEDAVTVRAQLLPTDAQVEEDVRVAPTDDVAFTTRVPTLQEALGAPVSLTGRFEQRDSDDEDEPADDEEEEEQETTLETGSDSATRNIDASNNSSSRNNSSQQDLFVTKALEHNLNLHKLSNLRAQLAAGTIDLQSAQTSLETAIKDFSEIYSELGIKFEETKAVKTLKQQRRH